MTCGNESYRQLWLVHAKALEWTIPASCQLEAWDETIGKLTEDELIEKMGLIATARPVESDDDHMIAIHTVGLAVRYGHDNLAIAAEAAGLSIGMPSVRPIYDQRGEAWWQRKS